MILATRGTQREITSAAGAVEARAADWSGFYPPPNSNGHRRGMWSHAPYGVAVPAIAAAVRLVSETIAGFVMRTYTGPASQRQPVLDTWQGDLFQDPDMSTSSFQFWEDVVTSLELWRGAFILKRTADTGRARRVVALEVLDPDYIAVTEYRDGTVEIHAWSNGQRVDVTREVIHIRGWSPNPAAVEGVATTELHRTSIAGALDYESFRGRYFQNDATPGIVLKHPGNLPLDQRTDLLRAWMRRHRGPDGRMLPGLLWGNMDVQQLNTSMRDSQGVELAEAIVRDVAREFRILPLDLLHASLGSGTGTQQTAEDMADKFMRFSLQARMRRIERGFAADRDLFPDRALYPRWDTTEFTRGDVATMARKIHDLVQVGALSANEGRSELGYGPHPDGDQLLQTPVGGAPNAPTEPPAQ